MSAEKDLQSMDAEYEEAERRELHRLKDECNQNRQTGYDIYVDNE